MRQGIDVAEASKDAQADTASVDSLVQAASRRCSDGPTANCPERSRGDFDTKDLVQEAALRMLKRRSRFEPRHAHSVQAYLRRPVLNLVRDEARRLARRPEAVDVGDEFPCDQTGPLEITIRQELRARYEEAVRSLRPKDQRLMKASVEEERHVNDIARVFGLPSPAAARMAVQSVNAQTQRPKVESYPLQGGFNVDPHLR